MKKLVTLALLLITSAAPAFADHIGIYRDATGQSCRLDPGYNATTVVMHRYSQGTTGVQFKVDFSNAPGSTFISFDTPFMPVGSITTSLSVGYGLCLQGDFVIGTITANLSPGHLEVVKADGYSFLFHEDCLFGGYPATGGTAIIGPEGSDDCNDTTATDQSTWGHVKALYRE
jgi:hypothetical protein